MINLSDDLYQTVLLEEAKHPKNVGVLEDTDVINMQYNVACGDKVQVGLKLSADGKKVLAMKWQGSGCAISTAAISRLSELVKGQTVAKVLKLNYQQILTSLGLKTISPGRVNCLTLGLKSVQQALIGFKLKKI